LYLLVLFLVLAGSAQAILPPDASVREPEIRAHRQRVEEAYQKRIQKRRDQATEAYEKATAAIGVPPWELSRVLSGKSDQKIQAQGRLQMKEENPKSRILVSIVLLILIGSAVGWVKYKTRDAEQ
jgi:hypothetical protein